MYVIILDEIHHRSWLCVDGSFQNMLQVKPDDRCVYLDIISACEKLKQLSEKYSQARLLLYSGGFTYTSFRDAMKLGKVVESVKSLENI